MPEKKQEQMKVRMRVSYVLTITLPEGTKKPPSTSRVAKAIKGEIREYQLESIVSEEMSASEVTVSEI